MSQTAISQSHPSLSIEDKFILEWSSKQNSFHIQTLQDCIMSNIESFAREKSTDYIPLMIGTREECDYFSNRYSKKLLERNSNMKEMFK